MRAKYLVFSLALLFSACGNGGNGEPILSTGSLPLHPDRLPNGGGNLGHPERPPLHPGLLPPFGGMPYHPSKPLPHPPLLPIPGKDTIITVVPDSGSGSSPVSNELATYPSKYTNLPSYDTPKLADISKITDPTHQKVLGKLYNKVYLDFKHHVNPSKYNEKTNYGLTNNFNQGFAGNGVVIGVIDSGTDDLKGSGVIINNHYTYKIPVPENTWNDLDRRLDNSNFEEKNFNASYVHEKGKPNNRVLHGKDVMATASSIGSDLRFANVPLNFKAGDKETQDVGLEDLAATVDALSRKGVRFFNRSFGAVGDVNDFMENPGVYFPAIMKNNALVVSAAGNYLTKGTHTNNALALDNPMRKGWIVALGYLNEEDSVVLNNSLVKDKQKLDKHYYIMNGTSKEYVYHWGDTCKSNGWDDCISASFVSNGNYGTSFSTPIVTATAALIYEKYPWMSNDNIKETLFTTAYEVKAEANSGKTADDIKANFGVGIINPVKAMNGVAEFRKDFNANVKLDNLYIFSNDISGTGGIIKDGIGTLALTGNNTFTGPSKVENGTLWLTGANKADFTNNATLRVTNANVKGITNNDVLINEGLKVDKLVLGPNSKIYTDLGETIEVLNEASLNGRVLITGVKYGTLLQKDSNVDIITAPVILGHDGIMVYSISSFLEVIKNHQNVTGNLSVKIDRIDPVDIPSLDNYASKNYQDLFTQIDKELDYEVQNQDNNINDILKDYNSKNLNGREPTNSKAAAINNFANMVLNTPKDKLATLTNKIFATDLYTNSLMNIARIKSIHSKEFKKDFNLSQSYNYNKISDLKESSVETLVNSSFNYDNSDLTFAFAFNKANADKSDFKNSSTTIGLIAEHSSKINDFRLENRFSYFNIKNDYNRFDVNGISRNSALLFSTKLGYEINGFMPFAKINALVYKQKSYSESGGAEALKFKRFVEDFYYANLGVEYKNTFKDLDLVAGVDLEYNFDKDYNFLANNILTDSNVEVSNGFYKKTLGNVNLGLNYTFDNNVNVGFDYKGSFAKDYITNKFMLGFGYIF